MFELLFALCLGDLCVDRLLPAPEPMSQAACEASAEARLSDWMADRPTLTAGAPRCVALADLIPRAAAVEEIAPGAFVHVGLVEDPSPENIGDISNHGFIIGAERVAVIDAGYTRAQGEALYLAIRARTDLPISHMLLTHMHPDHSLGARVFQDAGAEVLGARKLPQALESRAESYLASLDRLVGPTAGLGMIAPTLTRAVEGREEIDLGGRALMLQTYATAHTTNDMTIYDAAADTIWMGDLVFLAHTPALDGSITGWIALLDGLEEGGAKQIVPGHGPAIAPYPAGAQPTLDYLTALAAETRAAVNRGESLSVALKHLGAGLKGDWRLFKEFNPRNATNAYVELEWE